MLLQSKGFILRFALAAAKASPIRYSIGHIIFIINYTKLDIMTFRGIHSNPTMKTNFWGYKIEMETNIETTLIS